MSPITTWQVLIIVVLFPSIPQHQKLSVFAGAYKSYSVLDLQPQGVQDQQSSHRQCR